MGVVYKLKPQIRDFIIKEKVKNQHLSCRKFSTLINKKFQIQISKSRINSIIKEAGLSNRVGRTRKPKRGGVEAEGLGAFMLKAADYLVEGTPHIVEEIKKQIKERPDLFSLTEVLIYKPLFETDITPTSGLWKLINKPHTSEDLSTYLADLQRVTTLNNDIFQTISCLFQEISFLKITFTDDSIYYLDSQFHTLWSTPQVPYDFSLTIYKIKSYINKYFLKRQPIILFTAPGYELLPQEWLDFLIKLGAPDKSITKISLYDNKLKELEAIPIAGGLKDCFIIFGLWPWQYTKSRKVEFLGEFKPFTFLPQKKDFYLAETTLKLSQPNTHQSVTLKGAVLKESLQTKTEMVVLSNITQEQVSAEYLANLYLNRWPNLQDGFKEFCRKIELFTYSAASRQTFPLEELLPSQRTNLGIQENFANYLSCLDAYVRWYFLPQGYKEMDFSMTKERFYKLKAKVKRQKNAYLLKFILPQDYPFFKDLSYAIARMNEREVVLYEGKRLWFVNP